MSIDPSIKPYEDKSSRSSFEDKKEELEKKAKEDPGFLIAGRRQLSASKSKRSSTNATEIFPEATSASQEIKKTKIHARPLPKIPLSKSLSETKEKVSKEIKPKGKEKEKITHGRPLPSIPSKKTPQQLLSEQSAPSLSTTKPLSETKEKIYIEKNAKGISFEATTWAKTIPKGLKTFANIFREIKQTEKAYSDILERAVVILNFIKNNGVLIQQIGDPSQIIDDFKNAQHKAYEFATIFNSYEDDDVTSCLAIFNSKEFASYCEIMSKCAAHLDNLEKINNLFTEALAAQKQLSSSYLKYLKSFNQQNPTNQFKSVSADKDFTLDALGTTENVHSLGIATMQRIFKYNKLLEEIGKALESRHAKKEKTESIEKPTQIVQNTAKYFDLTQLLLQLNANPSSKLLLEGDKVVVGEAKASKEVYERAINQILDEIIALQSTPGEKELLVETLKKNEWVNKKIKANPALQAKLEGIV